MFTIQFKVRVETNPHQTVKIVGSLPQLGNWNPQLGLKLQTIQEGEWESSQPIQVAQGIKFYFKVVKVTNIIQWQKLPNNANRTFKPKFDSKLIINWSLPQGKVINESKNSYKVKGLPAAIIKSKKVAKKSSVFDPYHFAKINSDQETKEEDNFGFLQKKIVIKPKISKNDIQEIYYDTSQTQILVSGPKKQRVIIISSQLNLQSQFQQKIIGQIQSTQFITFKWLYYTPRQVKFKNTKKITFYCIYEEITNMLGNSRFCLNQLNSKNTYFVFLDIGLLDKIDINDVAASLYLQGKNYHQIQNNISLYSKFRHIVFDDQSKNQMFYQFLQQKNISQSEIESDTQASTKQIQNPTFINLIEQLKVDHFSKTIKVNTVYSFSIPQVLQKILQPNSFLIIDDELMAVNPYLFNQLINQNIKGRIIVVISQGNPPQQIKSLTQKHVISISNGFNQFRMKGKFHQPIQKHIQLLQMIKMKGSLSQQTFGGHWQYKQNCIIYRNDEKEQLLYRIQKQTKGMVKDFNYFKITLKKNRVKLSWSLSPRIRLIRTLCRLKYLSEGKIGNFYLISVNKNFEELKDQVKILAESKSQFLQYGLNTKVKYYNYGDKIIGNYTILPSNQ